MGIVNIRTATDRDTPHILQLNEASVRFLSPLDAERLALLRTQATHFRVLERAGQVEAFLLAFREGSEYDSSNYRWFASRFQQFLYVDRVVVSSSMQGQGAGKLLYDDLFAFAREHCIRLVTCEIDRDPPNPISQRFHERYGFEQVGTQTYGHAQKLVSLQAVEIAVGR